MIELNYYSCGHVVVVVVVIVDDDNDDDDNITVPI